MNKKIIAIILALLTVLTIAPMSAFAALPKGVPSSLDVPAIENIVLLKEENGEPFFKFEVKIPQSVMDLDKTRPTEGAAYIDYFWKIDSGEWEQIDGGYMDNLYYLPENKVPGKTNSYYAVTYPVDEGDMQSINIKNHIYSFKVQLSYKYNYGEGPGEWDYVYSDFSNVLTLGSGSFYAAVSDWAKPELQKASDLGLIPDILKGADMTKPITREEFCELSVKLYEKVTGKASEPVSPNPFNDTNNPAILKAFKIGITAGTSSNTFSPKVLINREQCAAMLFRGIKAMKPSGDFSIAGVSDFPDQKYISDWAVDATKYMSKMKIITGDEQGNFMPKATTTVQEAEGYGMATREQAVALAVRTYNKMGEIK